MNKRFVIYDARAPYIGTHEAAVLRIAKTIDGAMREARDLGYECAVYEYDLDESKVPPEAINERLVCFWEPPDESIPTIPRMRL